MTTTATPGGLSAEQLAKFNSDGYLIIPAALTPDTVAGLLAETHRMLAEFPIENHPLTRFTTGDSTDVAHVGDDYFLESGDKVRFFFEEDAFDAAGTLIKPKEKAINKIGHYLHGLSPPFAALIDEKAIRQAAEAEPAAAGSVVSPAAVARGIGFRDPRCLQSMVICKQPEIGGAVPPHQDSTFLYTNRPSAVGFWYALEDATLGNGCLSFLPGSHRWAPVDRRLVRKAGNAGTEMVDNDGPRFPNETEYDEAGAPDGGARDELYVAGEVKAGDLVLIHGNLLHKSERNTSQKGRIIYTFHVIEGEDREYDARNWLQPPKEGFTKLYV